MRNSRALLSTLIAVVGLAARSVAQQPVAPPSFDHVPLFPTRQNSFDIPFQIEEPIPGAEPVEVQLHVSEDRGTTWQLATKARPDEGRFSYRAAHDGEYLETVLGRDGHAAIRDRPATLRARRLFDAALLKCARIRATAEKRGDSHASPAVA